MQFQARAVSADWHVNDEPEDLGAARDARLMGRLKRLVTEGAVVDAAETLGVNDRILSRCLENATLSCRVRGVSGACERMRATGPA